MKKLLTFIVLSILLIFALHVDSTTIHAMTPSLDILEQTATSTVDCLLCTFIVKIINDFIVQNPQDLSFLQSIVIGPGSVLWGYGTKVLCEKIYKRCTEHKLRDIFSTVNILDIEIDQRQLLRRIVTLVPLCIAIYVLGTPMGAF